MDFKIEILGSKPQRSFEFPGTFTIVSFGQNGADIPFEAEFKSSPLTRSSSRSSSSCHRTLAGSSLTLQSTRSTTLGWVSLS